MSLWRRTANTTMGAANTLVSARRSICDPGSSSALVRSLLFREGQRATTTTTTTTTRGKRFGPPGALGSQSDERREHEDDLFEDWAFDEAELSERPQARERRSVPAEVRCFDTAKICAQSGKGGDGQVSFRREKYVPRGGPDGGNGGRGGHVWVVATKGLNSLSSFRNKVHFRAKKGGSGQGRNCAGAAGEDIEVQVPIGTIIRRAGESESQFLEDAFPSANVGAAANKSNGHGYSDVTDYASFGDPADVVFTDDQGAASEMSELDRTGKLELLREGERRLLIHGGRGGRGNTSFRTSTNKTPRLAEQGEEGMEEWFELELKLVADVGIVGAPNAGKSTLLAALSNAKPKIAAYPFTTLVPNLGVCDKLGYKSIVFADVPGLLEGAHSGVGLGQEFLRHCERTKVLVQVIDGDSPDPLGDYHAIRAELDLFSQTLSTKPYVVAINKADIPTCLDNTKELRAHLEAAGVEVHVISAVARQNIDPIVSAVDGRLVREERGAEGGWGGFMEDGFAPGDAQEADDAATYKRMRREADKATTRRDFSDFSVHFEGATRTWLVKGRAFESYVQMTDWQYYQAWQRFRKIIKVSGLYTALKRRGIKHGDTVCIGTQEFEWNNKMDQNLSYSEWKDMVDSEAKD